MTTIRRTEPMRTVEAIQQHVREVADEAPERWISFDELIVDLGLTIEDLEAYGDKDYCHD